jgi:hypothetical protein
MGSTLASQPGRSKVFSSKSVGDGTQYERSLSLEERRTHGRVYTPRHLVKFVLDQAGYTDQFPLETSPLLDPRHAGLESFLSRRPYAWRRERNDLEAALATQLAVTI